MLEKVQDTIVSATGFEHFLISQIRTDDFEFSENDYILAGFIFCPKYGTTTNFRALVDAHPSVLLVSIFCCLC